MTPLGKTIVKVTNPRTSIVVKDAATSILGTAASQAMDLLKVQFENIAVLESTSGSTQQTYTDMTNQLTKNRLVKIYPSVFEGTVGKLSGTLHLQVDPTVEPTRQPLRRIPLAMQTRLKDELERLERLQIIQREDEPTD